MCVVRTPQEVISVSYVIEELAGLGLSDVQWWGPMGARRRPQRGDW